MRYILPLMIAVLLACCSCDKSEQKQPGNTPTGASAETQQNVSSGQAVDVEQDKEQIKQCFENYKEAILAKDGKKVVQYVDQNTKDYYAQVLEWALTAKREEVENLPLIDRMQVLIMRFKIPAEQLRGMNGEDTLVFAVDNGMVGGRANRLTAGTVTVDGNSGKMEVLAYRMESAGILFGFNRENGEWKIDLTSILSARKFALELALRISKLTENEFIFESLKGMSPDQPPTDDLWNPVGK